MRRFFTFWALLAGVWIVLSAGAEARQNVNASRPTGTDASGFDRRDFSGVWGRFGGREGRGNAQGGAPFPEAGDDGFGNDVPPLTPEGQAKLDSYKPGYGRTLGSAGAAAHP